jgi:hypothetical protein
VACNNFLEPQFPREETITQKLMPLQGVTNPSQVEIHHPFLMVRNWRRTDSLFHIYDLRNQELVTAFGIRGQGPDDYVQPWLHHTQSPGFLIDDKNAIYRIDINDEGLPVSKEKKEIRFIEGAINAVFINDSLFVLNAMYLGPELLLLSINDETPRRSRQVRNPNIMDPVIDPDDGTVCANETRIARCYGWKKQIDFMDTDLNLIKSVNFKQPSLPSIINPENLYDIKSSYIFGYFGKKYLYVIFRGISINEYSANPSAYNDFLEIFDLDGNPVVRYRLDGIGTSHFVVDEETFIFYGIPNDGITEDYLVMYQLTGLS